MSRGERLVFEMFDSIIQDPIEKKILGLIVKNKSPEEIMDELLCEEERL